MSTEHPAPTSSSPKRARLSPLHAWHVEHGGVLTEFAGWRMPLRYGSDRAEHHAVRTCAGVFDLSHMGEIEVRGARAAEALDFGLVGDLSSLADGGARYTMICDESGGILDDLVVYRRTRDRFLVVANAANTGTVLAALEERAKRYPDVEILDASDAYGLVAIQGPRSSAVLDGLVREPIETLRYYQARDERVAGVEAMVARTGYTGEDGFELFVPAEQAIAVVEALLESGGDAVVPAGLAARDSLRLEAGMPLYGNELTTEVTPYEAGLGRVVRLDKPGDFVGRLALERGVQQGPVVELVGLLAEGRRAPRHGYVVLDRETGNVVGRVTSGTLSPTLERPIAMAYLERGARGLGGRLVVDVRGTHLPVVMVDLPFYKTARGGVGS